MVSRARKQQQQQQDVAASAKEIITRASSTDLQLVQTVLRCAHAKLDIHPRYPRILSTCDRAELARDAKHDPLRPILPEAAHTPPWTCPNADDGSAVAEREKLCVECHQQRFLWFSPEKEPE